MVNDSADKIRTELLELYEKWFKDVPPEEEESTFLSETLADDWKYVNYYAEERGKEEYLEYIKEVPAGSGPDLPEDLQIRSFDDIVIVHGTYHAPGLGLEGTDLRFSGAWQRTDRGWSCLLHHSTIIPAKQID